MDALPVSLEDIRAAREVLRGIVRETAMEPNRALSEHVGAQVHLKCENLQRAGSFKIRGAYTRMSRLSAQEKARGVVAASAGNHAQGVALAAQLLGISATVFMPTGAPLPKLAATRGYGADVSCMERLSTRPSSRRWPSRSGPVPCSSTPSTTPISLRDKGPAG